MYFMSSMCGFQKCLQALVKTAELSSNASEIPATDPTQWLEWHFISKILNIRLTKKKKKKSFFCNFATFVPKRGYKSPFRSRGIWRRFLMNNFKSIIRLYNPLCTGSLEWFPLGLIYRTCAIVSRGLYILLPHFQRPFMYCDLWPYVCLVFKSGF